MARIRLSFPERGLFAHTLPVRITDLNYGNHLGHDRLISMLHEARARFFRHLGFEEGDVDGSGVILVDLAVTYHRQVFFGQSLEIRLAVDDLTRRGCDVLYEVSEAAAETLVARAKTGICFFDYDRQQVVPVPAAFTRAVKRD